MDIAPLIISGLVVAFLLILPSPTSPSYLCPPCRSWCSARKSSSESRIQPFPTLVVHRLQVTHPAQMLAAIVDLDKLLPAVMTAIHSLTFAERYDGMRGVGFGRRVPGNKSVR